MGTWSPNVSANDYYLDIEAKVVETCGLDFFDYILENSILTPELFNAHYDEIVEIARHREERQGLLALGFLIMKVGAKIPKEVRIDILTEVELELTDWVYDDPEYGKIRRKYLEGFKDKLWYYREGEKIQLREVSLIGKSFIRELLKPALADMIRYDAPKHMKAFIILLIEYLDTPLKEICTLFNIQSGNDYFDFFYEMAEFGRNNTNGEESVGIILIADLFLRRVVDKLKIEDVWLGQTNLCDINNLELLENDEEKYFVYRAKLLDRNYIGQCIIPLQKRSAQHIAKFKVAP